MIQLAFGALILAIIATVLGAAGVADMAMTAAGVLFVIALILFAVNFFTGRKAI